MFHVIKYSKRLVAISLSLFLNKHFLNLHRNKPIQCYNSSFKYFHFTQVMIMILIHIYYLLHLGVRKRHYKYHGLPSSNDSQQVTIRLR